MTREGIDFSGPRPTAATLKAAGKSFVVRYVSFGEHAKEITASEARYWQDNGIDIVIVHESTAARALTGFSGGVMDADVARDNVIAAGGPSDGGVVYFAVDFDVQPMQVPSVLNYLSGAVSVLGHDKVGVYGGVRIISETFKANTCEWLWQTYAWSQGVRHPGGHLYQYLNGQKLGNLDVDFDRAYTIDFGQWNFQGDDMAASADQIMQGITDLQKGLNLALYGDNRDDGKDANTHPENLQYIVALLRDVTNRVNNIQVSFASAMERLGAIESSIGKPASGTLHVTGDLNVT